jgi:hypothetical protein
VHADSEADHLSRSLEAVAFTSGTDIFFSSGSYNPDSQQGQHLLAHEVAHTVQQAQGPVAGTVATDGVVISHPSDRFEQAAEQTAARITGGFQPLIPQVHAVQTRHISPGWAVVQRFAVVEAQMGKNAPKIPAKANKPLGNFIDEVGSLVDDAYNDVCMSDFSKWEKGPKFLTWQLPNIQNTSLEPAWVGNAIEERVYELMGGRGGGTYKGLRWKSQGSSLSKATLPDICVILSEDPRVEALLDISSDLEYQNRQWLHIYDKAVRWGNSAYVAFAAEVHYRSLNLQLLQQIRKAKGTGISPEELQKRRQEIVEAQLQAEMERQQETQIVRETIVGLKFDTWARHHFPRKTVKESKHDAREFIWYYGLHTLKGMPNVPKTRGIDHTLVDKLRGEFFEVKDVEFEDVGEEGEEEEEGEEMEVSR